jgi:hypothetical protein
MSTIVTRSGKGSPLTHVEVDANFTNLNSDKTENATAAITGGTINGATVGATTASTGAFTTLSASSTVSGTGFSTYLASPPAIGGTTPAAGTFTTLTGGGGSANYFQTQGSPTTNGVEVKALGSDTNIAFVIDSKGTGAIDLAAGSSGVNISNGGTVTALTATNSGSAYTTIPTPAITAPTTAGGVQAVATTTMQQSTRTIVSGGTGYTVNDAITLVGGTFTQSITFTVASVSGGVVTGLTATNGGTYSVLPTGTLSTTGGTGTGLTLTIDTWAVRGLTIGTAGSGYVEQPTVTFSGGGGSGAAAYASVGASTTIKTLFGTSTSGLDLATPAGAQVRIADIGDGTRPLQLNGGSAGAAQVAGIYNATSGAALALSTNAGTISFYSGGRAATEQLRVSHTASAVNYVQVTGAATGGRPTLSAQGSDTNAGLGFTTKGNGRHVFFNNNSTTSIQFSVGLAGTGTAINYLNANGTVATTSPELTAEGTDTNLDIRFTPKGTGMVRFGTRTASADAAITGYIEIKDSGGTTRRLAVIG